jgi:eukaryotic-like serine/threonine-protein kinase
MKQLSDNVVAQLRSGMQEPDLAGTRFGLLRYLARGGMGSVWLVEDTVLQRRVALKVLDLVPPNEDFAERLLQEARILGGLEHPGIVPVHDAGVLSDGRAFYCMKYVEGQTLGQHAADTSLPDRLRLLERVAEPVSFAHSRGVIHRDLKPENVMIGTFGEVLVMDWGLARIAANARPAASEIAGLVAQVCGASRVTGQGGVLGTPGYMSPEQARGDAEVDHRTDIFSLGAIMWFLLTGSSPGAPSAAYIKMPRPLRAICQKAMAVDPSERYQSAMEMTTDVAHYLDGSPVSAYAESLLERAIRIYNRHSTAIILILVYLLMRLLFILFARR